MELSLTMGAVYEGLGRYLIKVRENLEPQWADWFEGYAISADESGTMLSGEVADQAALYGLISKVRDLGLTLLSVVREEPEV